MATIKERLIMNLNKNPDMDIIPVEQPSTFKQFLQDILSKIKNQTNQMTEKQKKEVRDKILNSAKTPDQKKLSNHFIQRFDLAPKKGLSKRTKIGIGLGLIGLGGILTFFGVKRYQKHKSNPPETHQAIHEPGEQDMDKDIGYEPEIDYEPDIEYEPEEEEAEYEYEPEEEEAEYEYEPEEEDEDDDGFDDDGDDEEELED